MTRGPRVTAELLAHYQQEAERLRRKAIRDAGLQAFIYFGRPWRLRRASTPEGPGQQPQRLPPYNAFGVDWKSSVMIRQEPFITSLKLLASCHAIGLLVQPVLAGQYLGGHGEALALHALTGETVAWTAIGQVLLGGLCWYRGNLPAWASLSFVLIFALDGLQIHMGYSKSMPVHIPLGATLLALSFAMTAWLWRIRSQHHEI